MTTELLRISTAAIFAACLFSRARAADDPDDGVIGPAPMVEDDSQEPQLPESGPGVAGPGDTPPPKGDGKPKTPAELLKAAAQALAYQGASLETRAHVELARGRVEEALKMLEPKVGATTNPKRNVLRALALIRAGESAEAAKHLREAAARIESKGSVTLRNLSFASRVWSFGVWEKQTPRFKPGQRAMIYCEVLGFVCAKHGPEKFAVDLNMKLSIDRADGSHAIRSLRSDDVNHRTKSHLHDLHLVSRFDIPKGLLQGKYILQAVVTDKSTGAAATMGMPFEIAPPEE